MPAKGDGQAGFPGDVGEVALAVVAVEGLDGRRVERLGELLAGPGGGVDEEEVLVAVVVVVEEGDAGAHRLGEELFASGEVVVDEGDAGLAGDVDELDGGELARRLDHGGDGGNRPRRWWARPASCHSRSAGDSSEG